MKRSIIGFGLIFLLVPQLYSGPFLSLSDVQTYAAQYEEYPEIDNNDWLNPDFSTFHKYTRPGMWNRLLTRVKIKRPVWSARGFKQLLEMVVDDREMNGYIDRFVQKMSPLPGAKFIIFSDVHGALHSLIRDLGFLRNQGIISNDFKIKSGYYFIFNGNVIDRSPYSLETLTLVMRLMATNPHRVFYIKGDHEDKQQWHSYGFARELKLRAHHLSREKIPLNTLLTRFFNTLPLAVYLTNGTINKKINVVRISYYGREFNELDESRFAGFLEKVGREESELFKLEQERESELDVNIRALIRGEDRTTSYQKTKGLMSLEAERGTTTWAVLSSPIGAHRRLYEFFFDAFAQLTIRPKIDQWSIASFYQDVREMLGFKKDDVFNLVTGRTIEKEVIPEVTSIAGVRRELQQALQEVEELEDTVQEIKKDVEQLKKAKPAPPPKKVVPPKEEVKVMEKPAEKKVEVERPKELVFGSTLDLSKGAKIASGRVKSGVQLYIDKIKEAGGIDGMTLKVIFRDDEYTPTKARANIEQFLKDGIDMTLCSLGSPTLEAYVDLIKEGKVLALFPLTGAPIFRKPEFKYMIHYRACYCTEARVIVEYARNTLKANNFVVFYQNDAFGKGALSGARDAMKELKIEKEKWTEISYERNDVSFPKQAKKIKELNPDAIIFLSTSIAAKGLIRQVGVGALAGKKLFGLSDFAEDVFRKFAKEKGLQFIIVSVVPNPETSELEIVKKFKKEAKQHNVPIDTLALEGYISTSILVDLLKKIDGPITKDAIVEQAEKIKDYTFEGLLLNFNKESRELSNYIWLYTGSPEWERIVVSHG